MAEYIEREALIAEYDRVHIGEAGGARKLMVEAPACDVVEVVRCNDCRIGRGNTPKMGAGWIYCENNDQYHKETHFCSYGERKSDDV